MHKIISITKTTHSHLFSRGNVSRQELLLEANALISRLGTSEIPISKQAKEILGEARSLIALAILNSDEITRSRSSSLTSTGSLGDRIANHDKEEYLYTYKWVNRSISANDGDTNAVWARGNHFRTWVEHPYKRLPSPNSSLNCWEAVSVLLFNYHALTKQEIISAYSIANHYDGDMAAIKLLFSKNDDSKIVQCSTSSLADIVETGDILVFQSNRGTEMGHVALVLDNGEKLWVASHWVLPKEKMIKLTPNRILTTSKQAALSRLKDEVNDFYTRIFELNKKIDFVKNNVGSPELIKSTFSEDQISPKTVQDARDLYNRIIQKHKDINSDYNFYQITEEERDIISPLVDLVRSTIRLFRDTRHQFQNNNIILGIIYDIMDSFEQLPAFSSPLSSSEYLVGDSVTVYTSFRPFFEG